MNHGQFYKANQLVEAVHKNAGGVFAGFRAAHAFGRIYSGTFTPTETAKNLSRAAHFQDESVPTTARFSGVSGNPNEKPGNVVAMATKFYLPDGTVTDLIGITLPAFFARTSEEFFGFEAARALDPTTGKPDMAKLLSYLGTHPNAALVVQALQNQPAPLSLAQTSFRALHAFRFINAVGEARWARYHWEPEAGVRGQSVEELAKQPHDHLFSEFEGRLDCGPVAFRLDLQLGEADDALDDPSSPWPDHRERVTIGRLQLIRPITLEEIGDPEMMHDPTRVTDGIEISPDDQIIALRRGAYLLSLAERSGGWKQRSPVLAQRCPYQSGASGTAAQTEHTQLRAINTA
jgi:catalase